MAPFLFSVHHIRLLNHEEDKDGPYELHSSQDTVGYDLVGYSFRQGEDGSNGEKVADGEAKHLESCSDTSALHRHVVINEGVRQKDDECENKDDSDYIVERHTGRHYRDQLRSDGTENERRHSSDLATNCVVEKPDHKDERDRD